MTQTNFIPTEKEGVYNVVNIWEYLEIDYVGGE